MSLSEILKQHPFMAGLPDSAIHQISAFARDVSFQENEVVLETGQRSASFYLLYSGSACVEVASRSYTVWVQILGSGEAFGWSAFLDHHDTLFQVRTREASRALCLDSEKLASLMHADSGLAAELLRRALKLVAGRVQATEARLGEMCGLKIPKKKSQPG